MFSENNIEHDKPRRNLSPANAEKINRPPWHLLILGIFTGTGGALIGVGGGIIMVPILTMWGLSQKRAQGTSLLVIMLLAPAAVITYAVQGNIDFNFAIPLALGGVIGSVIGSRLAQKFSNRLLACLFGAFLILIVVRLGFDIVSGITHSGDVIEIVERVSFDSNWKYIEAGLFGLLAGFLAGFFGVGGGVVFTPTGRILVGLAQHVAQGSSLAAMIPTVVVAAITYVKEKQVDWSVVIWMAPGAWLGAVLGAVGADILGQIKNGSILTAIFAIFLLYTGVRRLTGAGLKCNQTSDT